MHKRGWTTREGLKVLRKGSASKRIIARRRRIVHSGRPVIPGAGPPKVGAREARRGRGSVGMVGGASRPPARFIRFAQKLPFVVHSLYRTNKKTRRPPPEKLTRLTNGSQRRQAGLESDNTQNASSRPARAMDQEGSTARRQPRENPPYYMEELVIPPGLIITGESRRGVERTW